MNTAGKSSAAVASACVATPAGATSFGDIKRSYASTPATNELRYEFDRAPELEAWARRAQDANGFGSAATDTTHLPHSRDARQSLPRTDRTYGLAEIFVTLGTALAAAARRGLSRWRRQRDQRATVHVLRGLDARTLRDIGLTETETSSTAADLAGAAEAGRSRVLITMRSLSL